MVRNTHILPDVLQPGLRVVFCGTAAGDKSASERAYFAGPGNQFWPVLHAIGLTPKRFAPSEFAGVLEHGVGLTDIAKLRSGSDSALRPEDYDVNGLKEKLRVFAPRVIAFNGKKAASIFFDCDSAELTYGRQQGASGPVVFVLPSTSGSARGYWDIGPWHSLAAFVASS